MNRILTICVHYKNCEQTQKFIVNHDFSNSDLAVVDNSNDLGIQIEKDGFFHLKPSTNLGYFGAAHFAHQSLDCSVYEFVIVANTDLALDRSFFQNLLSSEYETNVGVIAPYIHSSISKNNINPLYLTAPTLAKLKKIRWVFESHFLGGLWQILGYLKGLRGSGINNGDDVPSGTSIFAPHGSLLIFTKNYFQAGLGLKYPIFLYGEELWVAYWCLKKGLVIQSDWRLKATHFEHGSLGVWPSRRVWRAHRDSNRFLVKLFRDL